MTELDGWKVRGKNQFFRSSFVKHGLARLFIFYSTTRDLLYRDHVVPGRQGSAVHEIQKIIESPLG